MKIKILFVSVLISLFFLNIQKVFAAECNGDVSICNNDRACLEANRNKCDELGNTAEIEINRIAIIINLTRIKIAETEQKIVTTQTEIETLGSRIANLDSSLNYLSKLFLEKVVEGYKQRSLSFLNFLLNANNASELLSKIKYLKITQNKNQKIVVQVQQTKINFEEQKSLRANKIKELDSLQALLQVQKQELNNQQALQKESLANYKKNALLYDQAIKQLAAFKSFVQTSGASSVIGANGLGTGSDGAYYSQRDERWANNNIGYSSENILNVGCLLTSISMFAKKFGSDVTPASIASDVGRFWENTAWMRLPWPGVAGKGYVSMNTDSGSIETELNQGNPVIVGVMISNCYSGGNHYVLLTKKDGGDYIMHDPVYGPDLKFSSHYSTICSAATFK